MGKHKREKKAKRAARRARERARVDRFHARLEAEASERLVAISGAAADDVSAASEVLAVLMEEVQRAGASVHEEASSARRSVHEHVAPLLDEVASLRVAMSAACSVAESATTDLEVRHLELRDDADMRHRELVEQIDELLASTRQRCASRVEEIEAHVAALGASQQRAADDTASVAADIAVLQQQVADAQVTLSGVIDAAEMRHAEAVSEIERRSNDFGARVGAAAESSIGSLTEQVAQGCDRVREVEANAVGDVAELHAASMARLTTLEVESVASYEARMEAATFEAERRVASIADDAGRRIDALEQETVDRARALVAEVEHGGELLCQRRASCEVEIDGLLQSGQRVREQSDTVADTIEQIRSYAATGRTLVSELADRVRLVDALAEQIRDMADAPPAPEPGPAASEQSSPDETVDARETDEQPPDADPPPVAWSREQPEDDDFFGRIAAELRDDPNPELLPVAGDRGDPLAAAAESWDLGSPGTTGTATGIDVLEAVRLDRVAVPDEPDPYVGPVAAAVPIGALVACVTALGRLAGSYARIELVQVPDAMLRIVVHGDDWWDYAETAVVADPATERSVVVDFPELKSALSDLERFTDESDVRIVFDEDLTLGNYLVPARAEDVAAMPRGSTTLERLELRPNRQQGAVLETQAGRLFATPGLLAHLRRFGSTAGDLAMVDGLPHVEVVTSLDQAVRAGVVAPLQELGDDDDPVMAERREKPANEVKLLVDALSASSTSTDLEHILKVGVGFIRRRAAAHPALDPVIIDDLIADGTEAIRAAAASNPSITSHAESVALRDESTSVRAALAGNPALSPAAASALAEDPAPQVRARIGRNLSTTVELLERLAADDDSTVRASVGSNEYAPAAVLRVLARDADFDVCAAVAGNRSCPPETLDDLVSIAPREVLANPSASSALLIAGAAVDAAMLRAAVAQNPAAPSKALRKLSRDRDSMVLGAVVDHPAAPTGVRRRARRTLDGDRQKPAKRTGRFGNWSVRDVPLG